MHISYTVDKSTTHFTREIVNKHNVIFYFWMKWVMEANYEIFTSNLNEEIPVPRAYFKLKLKRNPTFYNLFMIFPCIIVFSEYKFMHLHTLRVVLLTYCARHGNI